MYPETHRKRFCLGVVLGVALAIAGSLVLGSGQNANSGGQAAGDKKDAAGHKHDHDKAHTSMPLGDPKDRGKLMAGRRALGLPPVPVETPDIPKLPWKMNNGVKEFHLTAEHMQREFLPDVCSDVWGDHG